jgi:enduracididine biosynthesis enzyme MppP
VTPNLTELEWEALDAGCNVADGHARQDLTPGQAAIVAQFPALFEEAAKLPPGDADRWAQAAFLAALGQRSAPADNVLSCYASSVAMEIFARAAHAAGVRTVALVHPTFDNIADILRGVGLALRPVEEPALLAGDTAVLAGVDALFLTTPNNPTGTVLPAEQLAAWASACADRGVLLTLDTSFRGFDTRACYDHYRVLAGTGCRYVVIEDTGKLWPVLDLKLGLLVHSPDLDLPLAKIHSDILLNVSPFVLRLVELLSADAAAGGFDELRAFVRGNRALVRGMIGGPPVDPDSRVSVERIAVPSGRTGTEAWRDLAAQGVRVLPCRQFHWADPAAGERHLRVSLARPPAVVEAAATAIARYFGAEVPS